MKKIILGLVASAFLVGSSAAFACDGQKNTTTSAEKDQKGAKKDGDKKESPRS
jgi:Ni/Co efflux regulator RcnB